MLPISEKPQVQRQIDCARERVLAWLHQPQRNPHFLEGEPEESLRGKDEEIVERFLSWIRQSGFEFDLVNNGGEDAPAFEAFWVYRGASFVGFKQPPHSVHPEDAKLLGCAALLENDWCRDRLT